MPEAVAEFFVITLGKLSEVRNLAAGSAVGRYLVVESRLPISKLVESIFDTFTSPEPTLQGAENGTQLLLYECDFADAGALLRVAPVQNHPPTKVTFNRKLVHAGQKAGALHARHRNQNRDLGGLLCFREEGGERDQKTVAAAGKQDIHGGPVQCDLVEVTQSSEVCQVPVCYLRYNGHRKLHRELLWFGHCRLRGLTFWAAREAFTA